MSDLASYLGNRWAATRPTRYHPPHAAQGNYCRLVIVSLGCTSKIYMCWRVRHRETILVTKQREQVSLLVLRMRFLHKVSK